MSVRITWSINTGFVDLKLFVCCHYKKLLLSLIWLLPICLFSAGPVCAGDPFGFNSSWNYRKNGGDTGESSQFSENYNLTYGKELTGAMNFTGSVRYSESQPSEGGDSSTLNPSLSLDLLNDLFSLNLNATETQSEAEGQATRTVDSWGFNLNSRVKDWPSLRFYFDQSTSGDDGNPPLTDSESTNVGASLEYTVWNLDLLYDVRGSKSSDNIHLSETETLDQTAQISYDQSFLQGRVSVSASQQYQKANNTTETRVGIGNTFFVDIDASSGWYAADDSPDSGSLSPQSDLVDGDFISPTAIDIFGTGEARNMAARVNFESTDRIEVFLDQQLTPTQQSLLSWRVYRSDNNSDWVFLGGAVSYLSENSRTVVTIDLPTAVAARYVKVVSDVTLASASPVYVTELQASAERVSAGDVASISTDSTNLQTQFSSMVRVTDSWSISYSLRRAEAQQDRGDTVQFSQSLTSSYDLNEKVGFTVGVAENTDEADQAADRHSRSYSLSTSLQPLSTLNVTLGYTRSESDSDDGQDTASDTFSSTLNATIYPDLSASLTSTLSKSENLAEGTESNSFGLTANTTAYLSPQVDLSTSLGYTESESSNSETSRSTTYGLTLGYRPSDMLLLNCSYDGDVEDGRSSFTGTSNWLWSKKLQTQFGLSYDFGDETSQQYNALLSWLVSRSLSLQSSGNYLSADEGDSWSFNASVNLIF